MGGASVFRIAEGGEPEVFADGFTNIVDIAFGPDGSLLVLEIAANSLLGDPPAGGLTRVTPDGARETLISEGLFFPTGLAIEPGSGDIMEIHKLIG
jgi:sugar lactone lactonase YvrE